MGTHKVQNEFLNALRRERRQVAIFLVNGIRLTGRIQSFDAYMVYLTSEASAQAVFKHSISTIGEHNGLASRRSGRGKPSRPTLE
jgi:host factor-I protein